MPSPPPCLSCGVCCFSELDRYVEVRGDDHARLGDAADALVEFHGNKAYMRMQDGRCAALVLDAREGRFACSIYEQRPKLCRELERGSPQCEGELALKGERPSRARPGARG